MVKFITFLKSVVGCSLFSAILGGVLAGFMDLPYNNTGYDLICAIVGAFFGIFIALFEV
jgi:hypothetical protein